MDITRAEQIALDDALSKEATLQVVYDVLKLTPFYKAFQITTDVPKIYMQEFWATATVHHNSIHFKMNNKKHIVNLEYFMEMLQICPKLSNQQFEELPFEEEILTFLRNLSHSGEIKVITNVNVNKLHQPWRSFIAVINKCLSGKSTGYDSLRLSQAQILWGMYHKKNIDYAYLLWEDFVYQVETKNAKRGNEMYYSRFTKVIINFFMTKDQSIPRRNSVNWHFARNDYMFTTIKVVFRHEDTQLYGAEPPKTKASVKKKQVRFDKTKTPLTTKGKRLKTLAKVTKPSKKKLLAQVFETLSEVALTEEEQMRTVTKRSLTKLHSSHASGSGADEGTCVKPGVLDQNDSDNDGDDFVHPKFSTHDEEDKEEDSFDPRVQTPSHVESTDDENSDKEIQGANVEGDKLDEEETNKEDEENELYKDVNVNLEGRDIEMTDAQQTNSSSMSSGFISNMLNPSPNTGIDSIFNLNTKSTSLVDVSVTTIIEPPLLFATTLPPPPTPLIKNLQQTPVPTPATVPSSSLQDLPNFDSLFKFHHRLKTLEDDFSEFKQTNPFVEAVSSIPGIVDAYIANKMNEAVKTADQVKEQVKAQVSKILPRIEKDANEQLEAKVLTHSSNESKTSHAIAANLSKLELKKILIDKMERISQSTDLMNRRISTKHWLTLTKGSKRRRDGKEPESTSAPKEKTSKSSSKSKDRSKSHQKSTDKYAQAEEQIHTIDDLEEPAHQEFKTEFFEDQPVDDITQHHDWFQKPTKLPTPDCDWNKTLPTGHGPIQPCLSTLSQKEDPRELFNELMDTPLDFSAFMMNRLKVDTLTPELLVSLTFELMKGSCKSLVELEYFFEEVYKETTDQLDWNNPEVIPFNHFINNDLAYLSDGVSSQTYTTSVTKINAADYGHIKWIKDLVPNTMEFAHDVYSKCKIIAITNLQIIKWHNYKQLDWINVRRDDDKLYKFKEGNFKRLHIQDIEDMLLLLVQGKSTNLTVEERLAFNNKDKKNRLMRIDELKKFSDGTLNDVQTALDDLLKGIRMKYLPQTILRKSDKDKARAMIQEIDK
ncbi:hypothetical protein Tco_0736684 [Tanacetum coccineum]